MSSIIHVLYINDDNGWFAQCLDYDIAAQGDLIEEAERAFFRTYSLQLEIDRRRGRQPLSTLQPAPEKYWTMAHNAQKWKRVHEPACFEDLGMAAPYMIAAEIQKRASGSFVSCP